MKPIKTPVMLLVEVAVDLDVYGVDDVADIVDAAIQRTVHWRKRITVVSPRDAEKRR